MTVANSVVYLKGHIIFSIEPHFFLLFFTIFILRFSSDGVGKMRNSLRSELSQTKENEQLAKIDELQETLFGELESVRTIISDPIGKANLKQNYKRLKFSLDNLISNNKQLSVLVQGQCWKIITPLFI